MGAAWDPGGKGHRALPSWVPGRLRGPRRRGAHARRHGAGRDRQEGHCHHSGLTGREPSVGQCTRPGCCRQRHISVPGGIGTRAGHKQGPGWFINRSPKVDPEQSYSPGFVPRRSIVVPLATAGLLSQQDRLRLQMGFPISVQVSSSSGMSHGCGPTPGLKTADGKRPEARRPARSAYPGPAIGQSLWEPTPSLSVTFRDQSCSWPARAEPPICTATGVRWSHPVARAELADRVLCAPGRQLALMCYGGDREAPGPGALRRDEWVREPRPVAEPVAQRQASAGSRPGVPAGWCRRRPSSIPAPPGLVSARPCFGAVVCLCVLDRPARGDGVVCGETSHPTGRRIEKPGSPGRAQRDGHVYHHQAQRRQGMHAHVSSILLGSRTWTGPSGSIRKVSAGRSRTTTRSRCSSFPTAVRSSASTAATGWPTWWA